MTNIPKLQIHHILPIEMFNNNDLMIEYKRIMQDDMTLQSYNNRIALFEDSQIAGNYKKLQAGDNIWADVPLGSSNHNGGHSSYNTTISNLILIIIDNNNLTPEQKKIAIIDLQATIKEALVNGELNIYDSKENIKSYLDQHSITTQQIQDGGERYQKALGYEQQYLENDSKHPDVKNDPLITKDGSVVGANNDRFVLDFSKQMAEIALNSDMPLTNGMRTDLNNIVDGGKISAPSTRYSTGYLVKAKMYVDGITNTALSPKYKNFADEKQLLKENIQTIQKLTESLKNNALSDAEKSDIQSKISKLQGEKVIIEAEISKIQATKESLKVDVNTGKFGQGGAIDIQVFGDALTKSMQIVDGAIETIRQDTQQIIKNNMLNIVDGQIKINPEMADNLGKYLKDNLFGGKVGAGVMAADFLNNTFEGLVVGLETGDWTPFQELAQEYGPQAVIGTVIFAAGAELIPVVAGLLGVPILGEVVLAGLLVYGAYQGGKAVGSIIYKAYEYATTHDINWDHAVKSLLIGIADVTLALPNKIADLFNLAQKTYRSDPLTLDLDHDGLETRSTSISNPIMFDHTGNGIKTNTGWVLSDDGFLVFDRNGNGKIDNGTELFGDSTPLTIGSTAKNGFEALVDQDTNKDGIVDSVDAHWNKLQVWRDLNQDGISQTNELFNLSELAITGFNVKKVANNQILENGNEIADLGTYYKNGVQETLGEVSHMADINLINDTFHRVFNDPITVSQDVTLLPNVVGAGKLRDLHEAIMQSSVLKNLVIQLVQSTDYLTQKALITEIIKAWVATDTSYQTIEQRADQLGSSIFWKQIGLEREYSHIEDYDRQGQAIYDQTWQNTVSEWEYKLKALEVFNGRYYFKLPDETNGNLSAVDGIEKIIYTDNEQEYTRYELSLANNVSALLDQAYAQIIGGIQQSLLLQTSFKPLIEKITFTLSDGNTLQHDYQLLNQYFEQNIQQNFKSGITELNDFNLTTQKALIGSHWQGWNILNTAIQQDGLNAETKMLLQELGIYSDVEHLNQASQQTDFVVGIFSAEDDYIYFSDTRAIVFAGQGNDRVYAGNQDVKLYGEQGDDELIGGAGNDLLDGGGGNDVLRGGYGINTYIFKQGYGQDTIYLETLAEDVPKTESYTQLDVLSSDIELDSLWGTDLIIKIKNSTDQLQVNDVFQTDTTFKSIQFSDETIWDIENIKTQRMIGNEQDNYLFGFEGRNNIIYGHAGNDYLTGQSGDDQLYGGEGDDILLGGDGNDFLDGGTGNDVLDGGSGINTYLFNRGDGQDEISAIYIDETTPLTETHIKLNVLASDIEISNYLGYGLILKIKNTDDQLLIRDIYGADSVFKTLTFSDQSIWTLEDLKNFSLIGNEQDNYLTGFEGRNNIIYGNAGNDNLTGQSGNDQLYGGEGDDYLSGNDGNDQLYGGSGTNTLVGGTGNDSYFIDSESDSVYEYLKEGTDTVYSTVSISNLFENVENITLAGDTDLNAYGNTLSNILIGNQGNNLFGGGKGNDTFTGGAGSDTFLFDTTLNATINVDTITDFEHGVDKIQLSHLIFTKFKEGNIPIDQILSGLGVTAAQDKNDYLIYDQTTGKLSYDSDGNGTKVAVHFATLVTKPTLTFDDFYIV